MSSFVYIVPWVFASVGIGILVGMFLNRVRGKEQEASAVSPANRTALRLLDEVLGAADRIATDVETHNTEIEQNAQQVDSLHVSAEMEATKHALMHHVQSLLESNQRLQEDLKCTRYRLEEQAQEIDRARQEARRDALTGVANRRAFDEKLHLLLDNWRRKRETFVLILADLDQFKWINDAHGHQVGDRVLQGAGAWLKKVVREGDFVARFGGDEFAVLLPHADLTAGLELAEIIRYEIAQKVFCVDVHGGKISVSLSIGVTIPASEETDGSMLRHADQALYRSKRAGRNHVAPYDATRDAVSPDETLLNADSDAANTGQVSAPVCTLSEPPTTDMSQPV
jgi:diguanylate cyclase